jgi:predicted ABC-type ATPase
MKLTQIILEDRNKPKAVIMAGGAGSGKTYLLNQLELDSLQQFNPDKYVEDPDHPYHNKLGPASNQVTKDVQAAAGDKTSFVWDTTASGVKFDKTLQMLKDQGYDIYMVLVYTHPMIAYAKNFERGRNVPATAVFSTWRNAYQKIQQFDKMTNGNFSIFVNDHGGKYKDIVDGFNTAAQNGVNGIKDYLKKYNEKMGVGGSSFFQPVVMSKEEEQEFEKLVADFDYDRNNRSEDKAIKKEFLKHYTKNGIAPGIDQLKKARDKYRDEKVKRQKDDDGVLDSIANMIFDPVFQSKLTHSSPKEINQKLQNYL